MWISTNGCFITVKERFTALSRFKQIVYCVFAVHLFIVFVLCAHHVLGGKKPKTKIVVRTVQKAPLIRSQVVVITPPHIKSVKKGVSSAAPSPKKCLSPAKPKVVTDAPSKPFVEATKKVETSLLEQVESQLAAIEESSRVWSKPRPLTLPKEISPVEEEVPPSYGEKIVDYLQNALELPEMGEVKVDLELDGLGHIVRIDILETKSKKNGEFLKKRLPELELPCFNGNQKSDATVVFTITFKNMDTPSSRSF